ncbi:hypothetical protein QUF61_02370, partial [Candidatus Venteria ishoeyi]
MKIRVLYKANAILTAIIFLVAIFVPFFISIIENDKQVSKVEKRVLSKRPKLPYTIEEAKKFPKLFNTYYSDNFGLRDWLTTYYKLVKYNLGDTPSQDVTIGKDGWLFLGSIKKGYNRNDDPVGDYRNTNLYSQKDLEAFANYMTDLNSWLNAQGIEYLFVIAPNKHTIYANKLPDYIDKVNKYSATDQIIEHLRKHTDISVIDLRQKLINQRDKQQLYYKIDSHWNHYAANIAQYEIMQEVEKRFPGKIQVELKELKDKKRNGAMDLATLMGVEFPADIDPQPIFNKSCIPTRAINANDNWPKYYTMLCEGQKLKTLIFRDSFFVALEPYFSRKFKQVTYVWEKSNYLSLIENIKLDKPDIVIEEWVERMLPFVPKGFNTLTKKKIFNNSHQLIFSNDWNRLKISSHINIIDNKDSFHLISTKDDPIIIFPSLPF